MDGARGMTMRTVIKPALLLCLLAACTDIPLSDRDAPLETAAGELAIQLADADVRAQLRAMLAERRTGDFELLLDDTVLTLADGSSLRDRMAATGAIDVVPNLQVAAPLGVAGWTDLTIPLVTFVSDEDAPAMVYFTPDGSSFTRPASERPEVPVLVLGSSDRSDREAPQKDLESTAQLTSVAFYLRAIYITDPHEPWLKGDPEIYVSCSMHGQDSNGYGITTRTLPKQWTDNVNDTYTWYVLNRHVADFRSDETYVFCNVMEADSDSADDYVGHAWFSREALLPGTGTTCVFDFYNHADLAASDVAASTTSTTFGPIPQSCANYWHY